jgi:phage virion morphogenesis protein
MTQIQVTINDAEIQQRLAQLTNRYLDLTPALRDVGEYMLRKTRQRFDREVSPEGNKWAPLARRTIRAKRRRVATGKPYRTRARPEDILKDTFTLRDSITYQVSNNTLAVGTNIKHGIFHQSTEPRTKIPRRAFLGLDEDDRTEALDLIREYLSRN